MERFRGLPILLLFELIKSCNWAKASYTVLLAVIAKHLMLLEKDEEDALDGKHGESLSSAYRILVAIGEATNAERLLPVRWAHVSGVNYNTIGDSGLAFLEKFAKGARAAIRTTINPMGFDRTRPLGISADFQDKQARIVSAYERMGVEPSFTCTPYEVFEAPERGTAVSFAESNAAVFANSMQGLRTNKESALSALASAVTGKAPLSDLRARKLERPVTITAEVGFQSELDFGLLGYFAGKAVKESSVSFRRVPYPSIVEAKALSGGMGTSGSCGMFTIDSDDENVARETIPFGNKEASDVMDELSSADDGEIIALGSPQLGVGELELLSKLVQGKKFDRRCMIFCSRAIHNQAQKSGLTGTLEKAGAEIMCDSCACLTPYITKNEFDSVVANSVKGAYYLSNSNKLKVALKDIRTIAREYAQ